MSEMSPNLERFFADSDKLRGVVAELDRKSGFVPVEGATAAKAREMMRAEGIRAEDNIFTCLLYKMRDGENGNE